MTSFTMSASLDYEKKWAQIDEMLTSELYHDAYLIVDSLHVQSISQKDTTQQLKAHVYKAKLAIFMKEKGFEIAFIALNEFVQSTKGVYQKIGTFYLAEMMQAYLDKNRFAISKNEKHNERDYNLSVLAQWDIPMMVNYIEESYLSSLEGSILYEYSPSDMQTLIVADTSFALHLRPTMMDVLLNNVLTYFESTPYNDYQPVAYVDSTIAKYFLPAADFINADFSYLTGRNAIIVRLYKKIFNAHRHADYRIRLDYDMRRLAYFYHICGTDAKPHYRASLERLITSSQTYSLQNQPLLTLAKHTYEARVGKDYVVSTKKYLKTIIDNKIDDSWTVDAKFFLESITAQRIDISFDNIVPKDMGVSMGIQHSYCDYVDIGFIRITAQFYDEEFSRMTEKEKYKWLNSAKISFEKNYKFKANEWELPQTDFVRFNDVSIGQYIIVAKPTALTQWVSYASLHVSDIFLVHYTVEDRIEGRVYHRMTGHPIKNATVRLQSYDYRKNANLMPILSTYKTNSKGEFIFEYKNKGNVRLNVHNGKDVYYDHNIYHATSIESDIHIRHFSEVYTDRSIYRPGQTVQYKIIALSQSKFLLPNIRTNQLFDIIWLDPNGKEISRSTKNTNDLGSASGTFSVPHGLLNGNYSIQVLNKNTNRIESFESVQVEAYKRPSFELKVDTVLTNKLDNGQITLKGIATDYASFPVINGQVRITLSKAEYNFYGYGRGLWNPQAEKNIISEATVHTDNQGHFIFTFDGVNVEKQNYTLFIFDVNATNETGETQSISHTISTGAKWGQWEVFMEQSYDVSTLSEIKIHKTDMTQQAISMHGTLTIIRLKEPKSVPQVVEKTSIVHYDQKISLENSFNIDYKYKGLSEDKIIYQEEISGLYYTKNLKDVLTAGIYKVIVASSASDSFGSQDSLITYLTVTDFERKNFPKIDDLYLLQKNKKVQPQEKMQLELGVSDIPLSIHVIVEKNGKKLHHFDLKVKNKAEISIPVLSSYIGNVNFHIIYVNKNKLIKQIFTYEVINYNEQLNIEIESFNDTALPGTKDAYIFRIFKGGKPLKNAEVLACMYDKSLDAIYKKDWRYRFDEEYGPSWYFRISETPRMYLSYMEAVDGIGETQILYPYLKTFSTYYPLTLSKYDYRNDVIMMRSASASEGSAPRQNMQKSLENEADNSDVSVMTSSQNDSKQSNTIRSDFAETVFYFPELRSDEDGRVKIPFIHKESLTTYTLKYLIHTPEMNTYYDEKDIIVKKNLIIQPFLPRFVRRGDNIILKCAVKNTTSQPIKNVTVSIAFHDIYNGQIVKDVTNDSLSYMLAEISPMDQRIVEWKINVPESLFRDIKITFSGVGPQEGDASAHILTVLSNRIKVVDTYPLYVNSQSKKKFSFDSFKLNTSPSKKDMSITLEYVNDPRWYAITSLPYVQKEGDISTIGISDRWFSQAIGQHISYQLPQLKEMYRHVLNTYPSISKGQLNGFEDVKSNPLIATPWVSEADDEIKKWYDFIAFYDVNKLNTGMDKDMKILSERINEDGGFSWVPGFRSDVYVTQYVLENLTRAYQLGALNLNGNSVSNLISRMIKYVDQEAIKRYNIFHEHKSSHKQLYKVSHLDVHYMYIRSIFRYVDPKALESNVFNEMRVSITKDWRKFDVYNQTLIGLIALVLEEDSLAHIVLKTLDQKALTSDELGMYWNYGSGLRWYEVPIETHALILQLYIHMDTPLAKVDAIKKWLIKNRQVNTWPTSKSTSAAIYSLLLAKEDENDETLLTFDPQDKFSIVWHEKEINQNSDEVIPMIGQVHMTNYGVDLNKKWGDVEVANPSRSPSWGALFYVYEESLSEVKASDSTPLRIKKEILVKYIENNKVIWKPYEHLNVLRVGDQIKIRLTIQSDRDMDFVLLTDSRSGSSEPISRRSGYNYQNGLGFYKELTDNAIHYYLPHLNKGHFMLEEDYFVTHQGRFSTGISSIESYMSPSFSGRTSGGYLYVE